MCEFISWLVKKVTMEGVEFTCRYDLTIEELVKANRFRGYVNSDVNDRNFKSEKGRAEKKKAVLLCLNADASDVEVSEVMNRLKLEDANPQELLSLGLDYPNLQEKFPIVARRQFWRDRNGNRNVPYLNRWNGERSLNLNWRENRWNENDRFLAFRNSFTSLLVFANRQAFCRFRRMLGLGRHIF